MAQDLGWQGGACTAPGAEGTLRIYVLGAPHLIKSVSAWPHPVQRSYPIGISQQLHQNSQGDPSYCPCATSPPQLGLLAASMQQLPAGPLCPFSTISSSATNFRGSVSCHVPVHRLRYRLISPTLAPCRLEHTRSGLYLVNNHKHGYGGGNTRFSWLPNGKTSHWDIFVSRSPLQCEVPAKPWLNPFLCLLSKSCLLQLHSSPCQRAKICAWFSVCPQLTNRCSTSAHLATENGNLQPKLSFLSLSWKICIHLLCFSSENQEQAMLPVYNNHTQKYELLQIQQGAQAFSLLLSHPWLVSLMFIKLSLRKGNTRIL